MPVNKGGRGKANPFESKAVRLPVPIIDRVLKIRDQFYDNEIFAKDENGKAIPGRALTEEKAKQILREKKSARKSLQSLLEFIYGDCSI